MTALAERTTPVKKHTDAWIKCSLCLYGSNFDIEIKQDGEGNYFYAEKCPKCNHYEEFKTISRREASRFLILEDLP